MIMVSILVFSVVRLIPGDPAASMAGSDASAETLREIRRQLGLDKPIWLQYWDWLHGVAGGDFGRSITTHQPVWTQIQPRAINTAVLTGSAMLLALVLGVFLGVIAAYTRGRALDRLVSAATMLFVSVPSYWVGLMLIIYVSVKLGWLPVGGNTLPLSWVLPIVVLALPQIGMMARLSRSTFIEILQQDYIRTARQKGMKERTIVLRHALPNGGVTILTFASVQLANLLAGSVVVEVVFAWPGLGRLAVDSLLTRDLPVVQGTVLLFALTVLAINLLTDVLYLVIDPRIAR
jgi:ABC-type dipeptide/oligopeptide/nickel transport system permease component